jgi:hypothetical protein
LGSKQNPDPTCSVAREEAEEISCVNNKKKESRPHFAESCKEMRGWNAVFRAAFALLVEDEDLLQLTDS